MRIQPGSRGVKIYAPIRTASRLLYAIFIDTSCRPPATIQCKLLIFKNITTLLTLQVGYAILDADRKGKTGESRRRKAMDLKPAKVTTARPPKKKPSYLFRDEPDHSKAGSFFVQDRANRSK
jgi:hypothetical protein